MNAMTPIGTPVAEVLDFLIVGAGISGIGMAVHLSKDCPGKRYAILERRDQLGGTWDLFRYPGIRSDSDMHTLGFSFAPWKHERSIADAPTILEYLNGIADEYGLRPNMRFGQKVISAAWDSATALWTVVTEDKGGKEQRLETRFLFMGSGYYDYDSPYDAALPGQDSFKGTVVHPQFWPEALDYQGKKVVVIGSGATAVTIVPAMVKSGAGHVTMLQRTPTWMISRPAKDRFANTLRKFLPEKVAYAITRAKNIYLQNLAFKRARSEPERVKAYLESELRKHLGADYNAADFTPPYNPWEQRLCLVPDADFFEAMKAGKAAILTDHIAKIDKTGIELKSGKHLDADVIVTATGLKLAMVGKVAVSVDGEPVDFSQHFYYRNCMFSNVPNFINVFGYVNASWTLRVDIIGEFVTRLIKQLDAINAQVAVPVLPKNREPEPEDIFADFSSGYFQRSAHILPKNAPSLPWRINQDYRRDRLDMRQAPLDDGILEFRRVRQTVDA